MTEEQKLLATMAAAILAGYYANTLIELPPDELRADAVRDAKAILKLILRSD